MSEKMKVRQVVAEHANRMEARLKEHEDKGGWEDSSFRDLILELEFHVEDLKEALFEQGRHPSVSNECADISNFAMMISENFSRPYKEKTQ